MSPNSSNRHEVNIMHSQHVQKQAGKGYGIVRDSEAIPNPELQIRSTLFKKKVY